MKRIELNGKNGAGKFAIVDDKDFERVSAFKWYFSLGYAVRVEWEKQSKKRKTIPMHRFITNTPKGMDTDHINGDRLDNQKENLRICTRSQNIMNSRLRNDNKCGYKGVRFRTDRKKRWTAQIDRDGNGKHCHLGGFETKEEAVAAYNRAASEYFGEYAKLNEPGKPYDRTKHGVGG